MSIQIPNPAFGRRSDELQLDVTQFYDRESEERAPRLPAEWEEQSGVQLTWPHAGTDWAPMLEEVQQCFAQIASRISHREKLLIVTPEPAKVMRQLAGQHVLMASTRFAKCPTNDTWARDHGALTLTDTRGPILLDFRFNGWGDKFRWELDNAITRRLSDSGVLSGTYADRQDFVLEGGSIESDGQGTLLTTSACLLNANRNPRLNKADIEEYLKQALHLNRVLWLDHGHLTGDDTDGHVDTLARFCGRDTIAYVKCDDPSDPHYDSLRQMEEQLRTFTTPTGQPYTLLPMPMADAIVENGERLPATYANFLIINGEVLCPTYDQPHNDAAALAALAQAFPDREITGIDCRALIRQHGSLHCVTMQYPRGVIR